MIEADILNVKGRLGREILRLKPDVLKEVGINEICDDIIANHIAYWLESWEEDGLVEDFSEFVAKKGNLAPDLLKLLQENGDLLEVFEHVDFSPLLCDPFSVAGTYEIVKSNRLISVDGQAIMEESLEHRKSSGMFYTPPGIVRFIVNKTMSDFRRDVLESAKQGHVEASVNTLLALRICDIACGTGSFLIEAINSLLELRQDVIRQASKKGLRALKESHTLLDDEAFSNHIVENSIYGVDVDRNAVLLCTYNVYRHCIPGPNPGGVPRNIRAGDSLAGDSLRVAEIIDPEYKSIYEGSLSWPRVFPDVFSRDNPGFDIIVMNPPYGKVRLESRKGQNRGRQVLEEDRAQMKLLAGYFRDSGLYGLSTFGVLNFYKLMVERALQLLREGGSLGFIAPSTFLCDRSTAPLRKYILNEMKTSVILEIPENSEFFEDITQSFSIVISSSPGRTDVVKFKAGVLNDDDLLSNDYVEIDIDFIRQHFPEMMYIPITSREGLGIFSKIHQLTKVLDFEVLRNVRGEVDLTRFSGIISNDQGQSRLIRGNNIRRYGLNLDDSTKPSHIDETRLREALASSPKLEDIAKQRIVCKQIANQSKKKRLEFAIVPENSILANSCNYITLQDRDDPTVLEYLLGFLNSSLVEWRFRMTSTNNHVNNYEIDDLPLIMPGRDAAYGNLLEDIASSARKAEQAVDNNTQKLHEARIDSAVFNLYDLKDEDKQYLMSSIGKDEEYIEMVLRESSKESVHETVHNHRTAPLSDLEMRMVHSIPEGGNWRDIPEDIDSKRVQQIRRTGGRTTYYGRLRWDRPAYTISTYFSRTGNGCFIHPEQHRLISLREGARLQSFPDDFVFFGTKTSMYHQIGNAVPPILTKVLADTIKPKRFVNPFCGAGGFALGLEWSGATCELALDFDKHCCETFRKNRDIGDDDVLNCDIREGSLIDTFSTVNNIDTVIGGPPCQGFSTAGKYILDDPRNELVKYFIEAVDVIQPKYFIMENVKGLTFFKKGQIIREIYDRFSDIGYSVQHRVLLAAGFGVPQLRERVFFVGRRDQKPIYFPEPLFSKEGDLLPRYTTVREAVEDLLPLEVGGGKMDEVPYLCKPTSDYQRLMRGETTLKEFYSVKLKPFDTDSNVLRKSSHLNLKGFQ